MERMQPPPYYGNYQPEMNQVPYPYPPSDRIKEGEEPSNTPDNSNELFTSYMHQNIGKKVSVYCSFTDSAEWHDEIFTGTLEALGDDYLVVFDKALNKSTLIMTVYINFIEFAKEEKEKK